MKEENSETDIESPATKATELDEESISENSPEVSTNSTADATSDIVEIDSDPSSESPTEKKRAPSPPRWRFVNEAKSTTGYNTLAAGSYIKGKSADELGAKYTAPDVSLYKQKEQKEDPGKLMLREWKRKPNEMPPDEHFPGLPKFQQPPLEPKKSFKEWDQTYPVGPKKGRETEWWDGKISDFYKAPDDAPAGKGDRDIGKLSRSRNVPDNEELEGAYQRREAATDEVLKNNGISAPEVITTRSIEKAMSETFNSNFSNDSDDGLKPPGRKLRKRDKCFLLLIFLLLLLVAVLGALLGKRSITASETSPAFLAGVIVAPDNTTAPSAFPSSTPSIVHSSHPSITPSILPTLSPSSRPSGNPSSSPSGLPSSSPSIQHSLEPSAAPSSKPSLFPSSSPTRQPTRKPSVVPTASPSKLPTATPTSDPSSDPTTNPTSSPSSDPTSSPSAKPTPLPTNKPTNVPTNMPTSSPSQRPIISVGGCPQQFQELSYYDIGTQVEWQGIIYECTSYSCGSYGFEPGSMTSSLWTHAWDVVGECSSTISTLTTSNPSLSPTKEPTKMPTSLPTRKPSLGPTSQPTTPPTPQPTCNNDEDFNLCIAIDMSGSVCNNGFGGECLGCLPAVMCGSLFLSLDTCCNNFLDVTEFAKGMVESLGEFPVDKSFSVVQFSTGAEMLSDLSSVEQTLSTLDQMRYAGGMTNHADGIRLCQESFALSNDSNRKNFIMLVTDGEPTVPEFDPEGAAEYVANNAKDAGTFVIPVFISPTNYDWDTLRFMRGLSSDGQVFDVGDFESLSSLQERLVNQVSCQS